MRTQMEEDIDVVRNHLGEVMVELEGWGPRTTGVPARLRQNAKPLAIGALALAAVGLWWARSRSRRTLVERMLTHIPVANRFGKQSDGVMKLLKKRLKVGIRPAPAAHPFRALLFKISGAGLAAAASVVARHVATRLIGRQGPVSQGRQDNLASNFGR